MRPSYLLAESMNQTKSDSWQQREKEAQEEAAALKQRRRLVVQS
jgi:hypothetical protein